MSDSTVWDWLSNPAVTGLAGAAAGALGTITAAWFNRPPPAAAIQAQINESFKSLIESYEGQIESLTHLVARADSRIADLKDEVEQLREIIITNGISPPRRKVPPQT